MRDTFAGFPIWRPYLEWLRPVRWPRKIRMCEKTLIPERTLVSLSEQTESRLAGGKRVSSCISYHKRRPG